jgi:hypothetical protein
METAVLWKPWKNPTAIFPPFPQDLENPSLKGAPGFPQFPQLLLLDQNKHLKKPRQIISYSTPFIV